MITNLKSPFTVRGINGRKGGGSIVELYFQVNRIMYTPCTLWRSLKPSPSDLNFNRTVFNSTAISYNAKHIKCIIKKCCTWTLFDPKKERPCWNPKYAVLVDLLVNCRLCVGQVWVIYWSIVGFIYRPMVGNQVVKFQWSICQVSVISRSCVTYLSVECQLSIGRVSVIYRTSVGYLTVNCRLSFGQVSATYRWSVDRLGFKCR